jgi:hypothetical protein
MREWNKAIQKMADAFELMKYVHTLSEEEERTVAKGLSLFCKELCSHDGKHANGRSLFRGVGRFSFGLCHQLA